jgi:hypothetical protein
MEFEPKIFYAVLKQTLDNEYILKYLEKKSREFTKKYTIQIR